MKRTYRIPVTITVSRESGKVEEVTHGNVTEDSFKKICQALTGYKEEDWITAGGGGKEAGNDSLGVADSSISHR